MSVSYTHLDVYKRQIVVHTAVDNKIDLFVCSFREHCLLSVSYTHLPGGHDIM